MRTVREERRVRQMRNIYWLAAILLCVAACDKEPHGRWYLEGDGIKNDGSDGTTIDGGDGTDGSNNGGNPINPGNDPLGVGVVGVACGTTDDCGTAFECSIDLPDGYCTRTCSSADPCPSDSECVENNAQELCYVRCQGLADCRSGYACNHGVCALPCAGDADCDGGEVCSSGACVGSGVGLACDGVAALCSAELTCDTAVTGGYCTTACDHITTCPTGSTCGFLLQSQSCLAACRVGGDCGGNTECLDGLCRVRCTDTADCPPNATCETTSGICNMPGPEYGDDHVLDLGVREAGTEIGFDVTNNTASITILVHGSDDSYYEATSVRNPAGTELIGAAPTDGPLRVVPHREILVLQIPNGDGAVLASQAGTWRLEFASNATQNARVRVILKQTATGQPEGGTVTLHLLLAPEAIADVSAANAAASVYLQAVLNRWESLFVQGAGVSIHSVTYADVDAAYTDITSQIQVETMFKAHSVHNALNVFVVRSIALGGATNVAATSSGVLGPPRVGGTTRSGIVIEGGNDALLAGNALCHEAAHFMGLFHTTEPQNGQQDLISDTPECLDLGDCPDARSHLMFPLITDEQSVLSEGSAKVIKANALVE